MGFETGGEMGEHGKNYVVILMICNLRHSYRDYQTKEYEMGTVCRTQQEKLLRVWAEIMKERNYSRIPLRAERFCVINKCCYNRGA